MSMWYETAVVRILNSTVSPTLTLIAVANPWMLGSPDPDSPQSLSGVPGSRFSQAMVFDVGGAQGVVSAEARASKDTTLDPTKNNEMRANTMDRNAE